MSDLGPQIRGIRDIGSCNVSEVSKDPIPVVSRRQLQRILQNIVALKHQGFHKLVLLGNGFRPFPPHSLSFAVGLLDSDKKIGLLHWKDGRGLVIRLQCLEAVATKMAVESDFAKLISALQNAGWKVRDVSFSTTPCEPFWDSEPSITEETSIMPVLSIDEGITAKDWIGKAVQFSKSRSWEKAIECFDHALEFNPGDADAWAGKGATLLLTNQYDQALHCCGCALLCKPDHAGAWFNKGLVLLNGWKNYREALNSFQEAERLGLAQASECIKICRRALGLA